MPGRLVFFNAHRGPASADVWAAVMTYHLAYSASDSEPCYFYQLGPGHIDWQAVLAKKPDCRHLVFLGVMPHLDHLAAQAKAGYYVELIYHKQGPIGPFFSHPEFRDIVRSDAIVVDKRRHLAFKNEQFDVAVAQRSSLAIWLWQRLHHTAMPTGLQVLAQLHLTTWLSAGAMQAMVVGAFKAQTEYMAAVRQLARRFPEEKIGQNLLFFISAMAYHQYSRVHLAQPVGWCAASVLDDAAKQLKCLSFEFVARVSAQNTEPLLVNKPMPARSLNLFASTVNRWLLALQKARLLFFADFFQAKSHRVVDTAAVNFLLLDMPSCPPPYLAPLIQGFLRAHHCGYTVIGQMHSQQLAEEEGVILTLIVGDRDASTVHIGRLADSIKEARVVASSATWAKVVLDKKEASQLYAYAQEMPVLADAGYSNWMQTLNRCVQPYKRPRGAAPSTEEKSQLAQVDKTSAVTGCRMM